MRRCLKNSVENWGWPPLFFNEEPLFPPISHKESTGKNFSYWCRKRRTQSESHISPKEKQKTLQCFLFQNGGYLTPKSSPRKVSEKSGKIKMWANWNFFIFSSNKPFWRMKFALSINNFLGNQLRFNYNWRKQQFFSYYTRLLDPQGGEEIFDKLKERIRA